MDDAVLQLDNIWVFGSYTVVAAFAFWIADFIDTLPIEIKTVWKRKQTGTSVLFLVNRYMFLVAFTLFLVKLLPVKGTDKDCHDLGVASDILGPLALVITNFLFALRVYAIYNKNMTILLTCMAFIIARFLLDILGDVVLRETISATGSQFENFSMCVFVNNDDVAANLTNTLKVQTAVPCMALAFDLLIFTLTVAKTFHTALSMRRMGQSSVTQVIIRDGTLYFLVMLVVAAIMTILTVVAADYNPITPFFNMLPNLLISRLMLNLRTLDSDNASASYQTQGRTVFSSLNFASNRMLGNIGAPLDGGSLDGEELMEEEVEETSPTG
ncbi:hypothetical protein J3R30DRAFT_3686616 [Lentinula aciculospora]|uniref:DUF6533 domain-containing protein n=1 Tax=Lentinula aciculospora TaxID=153920 RepID=A0A9W9DH49_9AGAR|nr:hypothetical protein J3R30DRAFT_3686616 [Lentinula aciculospora]